MFGAPIVVEPPPPAPIPYGLFSVLSFRESGADGRWQGGVAWEPLACGPASGIGAPDCDPEDPQGPTEAVGLPKGDAAKAANGEASSFTVYFKEQCSPVGRIAVAQDRATASLLAKEQTRVEQALWSGDLGNTPNFNTVESSIGYTDPAAVLGAVTKGVREQYGALGTIHVGLIGAAALFAADLLAVRGERVYSVLGEPVVIGTGYAEAAGNTTLPAADAGNVWMIGAPALFGYRSEIFNSSAREGDLLNRQTNDLYAVAERTYLIGWDPCPAAVIAAQFAAGTEVTP